MHSRLSKTNKNYKEHTYERERERMQLNISGGFFVISSFCFILVKLNSYALIIHFIFLFARVHYIFEYKFELYKKKCLSTREKKRKTF